jgi:hypothetical protein
VLRTDLEHLAGEAGGVPVGHGESSTKLDDASEFGGDEFGTWGEHGSEHGYDDVEGGIAIGERLGIPLIELNGEVVGGGALAGLNEQVGGDINTGDDGSGTGGGDREIARSSSDIEKAHAGLDSEASDEGLGAASDSAGDDAEVTGHPGGAHGGLDLIEIRG